MLLLSFNLSADQNGKPPLSSLQLGKNIYQKGILPDGKPITALGRNGQPFVINKTACTDCHRRSGLGSSESGLLIPPITKEYLFKGFTEIGKELLDRVGVPRPIYTEDTLKTAIRAGLRPNGEKLHKIMPRYKFSDSDIDHLITYLKFLGTEPIPGLTDNQIDFATVISPDMPEDDKELMLTTIRTYFDHINKDVRQLGHMKNPLHGRYKPYRRWKLHVWNLTGKPETWGTQLEDKYAKQPVFSLISGYGDWQPIHDFCEKNKVPSLFPITNTPVVSDQNFYTLYFSKGIMLDAEVVAEELIEINKLKPIGNILQIYNDDPASSLAAKTLREKLTKNKITTLDDLKIISLEQMSPHQWKEIKEKYSPTVLIIWLNEKSTLKILAQNKQKLPKHIYISSRLMHQYNPDFLKMKIPLSIKERVTTVHPFYIKSQKRNHLLRTKMWARIKKVKYKEEHIIANTYFGLALLTGAIHSSRYNLNREYLLERFEHMIDNTVYRSIYPHLSLGPDQRYASKGTYLIKASPEIKARWKIPYH